jgi:hypothetical protein
MEESSMTWAAAHNDSTQHKGIYGSGMNREEYPF